MGSVIDPNLARNFQWVKPGPHTYNTPLKPEQEQQFRAWVAANKVPFDVAAPALQSGYPIAKSAVDPNDQRLHYPDFWKTPLHKTFSNESQWALPTAPHWTDDDKLIGSDGAVIFDDRADNKK